jgi:hypothetical protein
MLFTSLTKQASLMRRSTVLSPPLQLVFPALAYEEKQLETLTFAD